MDMIRNLFSRKDPPPDVWVSRGKYYGLVNQGATCYLNSVLQVLFMTEDFRERVTSHTSSNPQTEYIDRELSELFLELQGKLAFTRSITNKLKINNVHEQHDAGWLYEKVLRLTSPEASQIFHGVLTHKNTCQKCHTPSESEARFWNLPLPLCNDDDYSVERGILDFFRPSGISGDDQMYCETCDEKCDAILECEMTHSPEVLVLLLKRFEFDHTLGKYFKICRFVDMPLVLNVQNQTYELHAFVEHLGDENFGRYRATIRCKYDGIWYIFDDSNVAESRNQYFQSNPTERSQTAYLLFYQKRKAAKYYGLLNVGATCYLNSILQVLFMTEDFRENIKNHVRNNPETEHIDHELSDLFSELEKSWTHTFNIIKKLKINNVHEQCDAAEHYEKILRLTSPEVSQIFHGELKNSSTCQHCKKKTEGTTGFWHLPLSLVDSKDGCSVDRSLHDFFQKDIQVQMYCENCDETCDANLYCELKHQPEVLVLLIKRFEYDDKHMRNVKNNTVLEVPYTLQMPLIYELYACVDHFGELGHGHYIATIMSKNEGRWYIFNDLSVIPCMSLEHNTDYKSQAAYLLFYRKQKDTFPRDEVSAPKTSRVEDAIVEQNTNEEEEESSSNTTVTLETTPKLSDETMKNGEVIHEKTLGIWKVPENNRSDCEQRLEEGEELQCDISDGNETRDDDVCRLADSFNKLTITDGNSSRVNQSLSGFSKQGLREKEIESDNIAQVYMRSTGQYGAPVNEQMYNQQSHNEFFVGGCAYNICAFESLMDIGGHQMEEGGESLIKLGEETLEMPSSIKDYRLKLTLQQKDLRSQGEHEKTLDADCSQARVTDERSVENNSLRQPFRIYYPVMRNEDEEIHRRVEATKSFIKNEQLNSSLPPVNDQLNLKRCEQREPRRNKEKAHRSRFDGVESLGVTKNGDTEKLMYKQDKQQRQDEDEQSFPDPKPRFVTQV